MLWRVYAVRDVAADVFLPPFTTRHRGEAIRAFRSMTSTAGTAIGDFPSDFALFELAVWDDQAGTFSQHSPVEFVTNGMNKEKANGVGQPLSDEYEAHVQQSPEGGDQSE